MEIICNKKLFLNKFLIPISKFTDQAIVNVNSDNIDCTSYSNTEKQSIILYTKIDYKTNDTIVEPIKLNIGSIKKFINALTLINDDIILLTIDKNSISYKSIDTNFRFHLKEDGILEKSTINIEKIDKTIFETEIFLSNDRLNDIIKASTFTPDTNKLYINIKDGKICGELTDKNIANIDNISVILSEKYTTTLEKFEDCVLKFDIFKIISSIKFDECILKINNKGVIMFEIKDTESIIKYITTSLIK